MILADTKGSSLGTRNRHQTSLQTFESSYLNPTTIMWMGSENRRVFTLHHLVYPQRVLALANEATAFGSTSQSPSIPSNRSLGNITA
jgi:hypothetical protein